MIPESDQPIAFRLDQLRPYMVAAFAMLPAVGLNNQL